MVFATAAALGIGCGEEPTSEAVCGDATVDAGEQCDDGNPTDGDGCSATCTIEVPAGTCGDGSVGAGEECDDGNAASGDGCSATCKTETAAACGDGTLDAGEECDDGNTTSSDGCSATCKTEKAAVCGDGTVDAGEACDDGNADDTDTCLSTCVAASCGDGFVQAGVEGCDDGNQNDDDDCLSSCVSATCGDGVVQAGVETCDDGNAIDTDACLSICTLAFCGDGFVQAGVETCDDGNLDDTDGCPTSCVPAFCGDGFVEAGTEGCDDGNVDDTDGCLSTCVAASCGDGIVEVGVEGCDDGNGDDGDACPASCQPASCGDGYLQVGVEACDDGNVDDTDGCLSTCAVASCGDGFVEAGVEGCDDGGTAAADGCGPTCKPEVLPYFENFDDNAHDLTLSTSSATVLWHMSTVQAASAPNSLRFANPATGTFDDGARVFGNADTPYVLVPAGGASVAVRIRKETESGATYDQLWIRALDVNDTVVAQTQVTGSFTTFRVSSLSIPATAAGTYVRVRFSFDSMDAIINGGAGVYLDDISIQAPGCGDGIKSASEECEDYNTTDGDGCDSTCTYSCFSASSPAAVIADPAIGCYASFSTLVTWPAAEAACVGLGGHLVSITSANENTFVRTLLNGATFYIGATDSSVEGTFAWSDGDAFTYSNWNAGEPNDSGGDEDCAEIYANGSWNDGQCTTTRAYVCEAP